MKEMYIVTGAAEHLGNTVVRQLFEENIEEALTDTVRWLKKFKPGIFGARCEKMSKKY